jgi:hypothetical protein
MANTDRYNPPSRRSAAPVAPEVARTAALGVARYARDNQLPREDLLDLTDALGITDLARPPRTGKARRR